MFTRRFTRKAAQERNKPPRVELSRLTVRQYRNAVADLIGGFRDAPGTRRRHGHGLRGEYFKSRRYQDSDRVIDRVDPEVKFDFGEESPEPGKMDAVAVLDPLARVGAGPGDGRVRVHRPDRPRHAALGQRPETAADRRDRQVGQRHRAPRDGPPPGRPAYPIRLEFSKAKQGVDDSKKGKKPKPVKASVSLEWKPPHRPAEVIPARNLSPSASAETFVLTTPFPPDDRSVGYERGTAISKAWDQATTDAAIETADYVSAHLRELAGVGPGARRPRGEAPRVLPEVRRAGLPPAARRRPEADGTSPASSRRRATPTRRSSGCVLLVLKSPRFLYREIGSDPYDVASRLSFGLWDSLPDRAPAGRRGVGPAGDPRAGDGRRPSGW